MVFSSLTFLFLFLPIFLSVYYLLPKKLKNFWIFVSSIWFYYCGQKQYVWLMILVIAVSYLSAILINRADKNKKRIILTITVITFLIILFYFKYTNFIIENLEYITSEEYGINEIILPVGVSFYIFQAISYVVDVYRGCTPINNFVDMGAYIACFPQLIAGPIIRYNDISQYIDSRNRSVSIDQISEGCYRFCIGLTKKVLLANNFAGLSNLIFEAENVAAYSVLYCWLGAIAYTFQIYFDFSGYSDMAIGLGKMLGFEYKENFNYPYIAASITDFWRRWHISLSIWFRDYVYIPLGGNRRGLWIQLRNLFIVWLLTGMWHGASWNYILWGIIYFTLISLEKFWIRPERFSGIYSIIYHIYTGVAIIILWTIFRTQTSGEAIVYIKSLLGLNGNLFYDKVFAFQFKNYFLLFLCGVIFSTPIYKIIAEGKIGNSIYGKAFLSIILLLLTLSSLLYILMGSYNPFLYFMF